MTMYQMMKVLTVGVVSSDLVLGGSLTAARGDTPPARADAHSIRAATLSAEDGSGGVLGALTQATPTTIDNAAEVITTAKGKDSIAATVASAYVRVPVDPADGIQVVSSRGRISIGLPFAAHASDVVVEAPGIVSYDNQNGSSTVPVVQDNGTVQINTVISSSSAPTRYSYPIALPVGGGLVPGGDGSVFVTTAQGEVVAIIAAPWAKDASGAAIDTRYEIAGHTLTQIVDHTVPGVVYPVVADPSVGVQWWGIIIKYNRAETKSIAAQASGAAAIAIACSKVPSGIPAAACAAAAFVFTSTIVAITRSAVAQSKCLQINAPYVPIPPGLFVVTC
jgi:hypothetical protein